MPALELQLGLQANIDGCLAKHCNVWGAHEVKKRTPLKNMKLDQFFLKVYIGQGGMLPTRSLGEDSPVGPGRQDLFDSQVPASCPTPRVHEEKLIQLTASPSEIWQPGAC